MSRFLKTNTATRVTVGPFFDKTDGITPETALTATNEKLTFMVDDGGVPTLVIDANATGSGGNNDLVHVTGDDAGFYDLELTAAQTNYVGRAMLSITYATDHCPVFHEFTILPAKVYDSLVGGTDNLEVDAVQWLGGTIAAVGTTGVPKVDIARVANSAVPVTTATLVSDSVTDASVADAVWDEATSGHTTAGTTGKAVIDILAGASPAAIADAVWDEATSGHTTAGTTGKAITDAQSAGDPWATTITGSETPGTTGHAIMKINRVFQ
jgi:hypothetical protein